MKCQEYGYENRLVYLPVNKILPNPYQTRTGFDRGSIDVLAKSIKNYGVLQPIGVRLINKKIYELIFGERRLMACKIAGIESIPAIVTEIGDREAAALTIAENMHRKNLHYIETADAVNILNNGFGYNEEEISQILSMGTEDVKKYIELNVFSKEVKNTLIKENIPREKAELLLKTKDSEIHKKIIDKVKEYELNNAKTEILVNGAIKEKMIGNAEANHRNIKKKFTDLRLFTNTLKQAVNLMNESGMTSNYEIEKCKDKYKICINIDM
ncbi:MAG: ParB/RepB/Spo0J family partition protein [Clostridia bacterium]|nr:ParB/RepB/Spo0J family partition protein [Clostridia bacterium]